MSDEYPQRVRSMSLVIVYDDGRVYHAHSEDVTVVLRSVPVVPDHLWGEVRLALDTKLVLEISPAPGRNGEPTLSVQALTSRL